MTRVDLRQHAKPNTRVVRLGQLHRKQVKNIYIYIYDAQFSTIQMYKDEIEKKNQLI